MSVASERAVFAIGQRLPGFTVKHTIDEPHGQIVRFRARMSVQAQHAVSSLELGRAIHLDALYDKIARDIKQEVREEIERAGHLPTPFGKVILPTSLYMGIRSFVARHDVHDELFRRMP